MNNVRISEDRLSHLCNRISPLSASDVRLLAAEVKAHRQEARDLAKLRKENEYIRMRFKESDVLFGKQLLVMRAAVIEYEHGVGAAAGINWIVEALTGPGELAPATEHNAAEYFQREVAKIDVEYDVCFNYFASLKKTVPQSA